MLYFQPVIYMSNCVLGGSLIVFVALSFAFNPPGTNLSLLGGVKWSHPTFLYAYVALFLQFVILQTIGWLGAWRLSAKILKAYWILLLLFTIFDVIGGAVWVKKFDTVKLSFGQAVLQQFKEKYSVDRSFTSAWNKMQSHELCCGVHNHQDFPTILSSRRTAQCTLEQQHNDRRTLLPQSCCYYFNSTEQQNTTLDQVTDGVVQELKIDSHRARRAIQHPRRPGPNKLEKNCSEITGGIFHESSQSGGLILVPPPHLQFRRPSSRKTGSLRTTTTTTTTAPSTSSSQWICPAPSEEYQSTLDGSEEKAGTKFNIHTHGCLIKLMEWLDDLIEFNFKLFCLNCFVQVFCMLVLYYAIQALVITQNILIENLSCPRHNPLPNPSFLPGERREFMGESFATTIFQPSPGQENNIWLANYEDDSESEEVATITASMGKVPRFNDPPQILAHKATPRWNEPSTSHFSHQGQHYDPQHYEFKPISNLSLKPETMGPSVLIVKPKCMYPAVYRRSNTERQQPSMGDIGHVSAISPVEEDDEERQCNIFLCCAYTEFPEY